MYDVLKLSQFDGPVDDPLLGKMPSETRSWHETKYSDRMQDYEEKLVIEWGSGKLAWRQRANEQNKAILEIRPRPKDEPFPPYIDFSRRLGELKGICPSWQSALKERKGVYLLTFDDGVQYVGSATGEQGFWQRWHDYLTNGDGGNLVLSRDHRDARNAMVSILEISGSAQTERDIVNREMLWQRKLGTRAKQLEKELP
jgi:hypothetical protein